MQDIKDIQIDILAKTIASLMVENAQIKSALMVMQNEKSKQKEVQDGEHQDSTVDGETNSK